MKTIKKFAVLVLALVLVLGMTAVAFADNTYTLTITNPTEGHTYTAYQIFKGDLYAQTVPGENEGDPSTTVNILSNITWGDHVNVPEDQSAMITAINNALGLTGEDALPATATARDVAEKLHNGTAEMARAFAQAIEPYLAATGLEVVNGVVSNLAPGYYLVKDDTTNTIPDGDTYSDFMLEVVSSVEITVKDSKVTVDKSVADVNDSGAAAADNTDTTDYDIRDDVPFTLTGTLPSNYTKFSEFTFTFTDTMSSGLTYNNDAVVTVVVKTVDPETGEVTGETVQPITDYFTIGCTNNVLTIACDDLVAKDATNKYLTNESVITVTFTAKLTANTADNNDVETNKVTITYSNDPNHTGTGTTPEDKVTVFTYKLNVKKTDGENAPLEGAGFTLYKLIATTEGETTTYDWAAVGSEVTAAASGTDFIASWNGLDDGVYKLVETTTPNGYNTAEDVYFEIVAEHAEDADQDASVTLTICDGTFNEETKVWTRGGDHDAVSATAQLVETTVINKAGSVLPSTGGIGTTLFYIIGAILVVGAGVLLIARRRIND